jgi:hypothetical protein
MIAKPRLLWEQTRPAIDLRGLRERHTAESSHWRSNFNHSLTDSLSESTQLAIICVPFLFVQETQESENGATGSVGTAKESAV